MCTWITWDLVKCRFWFSRCVGGGEICEFASLMSLQGLLVPRPHFEKQSIEGRQDGRVELELPSSHKNTKITTNCWTTIDKKDWNVSKKIFYIQRQRKSHNEMTGGTHLWNNQIPQVTVWVTHRLENKYIAKVLAQEWEFWASHWAPQPRGLALGGGTPRAFGLKASGAWVQELHRTGWKRDSTLGGCTQGFTCWDPGQSNDSIRAWARPTCGS